MGRILRIFSTDLVLKHHIWIWTKPGQKFNNMKKIFEELVNIGWDMSRQETGTCPQLVLDPSKLTHVQKLSPIFLFHISGATVQRNFCKIGGNIWKRGRIRWLGVRQESRNSLSHFCHLSVTLASWAGEIGHNWQMWTGGDFQNIKESILGNPP